MPDDELFPGDITSAQDESASNPYATFAYYYHLEYASFNADFEFYRETARQAGANPRLLELACGTGRLTFHLAESGFKITGIDNSPEMLEIARQELSQLPPPVAGRVTLVEADMTDLNLLGNAQYDFIFIAINSFQHLHTQAQQLACLQAVRAHLAPAGIFVVDVMNPAEEDWSATRRPLDYTGSFPNPATGGTVHRFVSSTPHPATQLVAYSYFYDDTAPDGTVKRTVARLKLRQFYRYELQLLLEKAGFQVQELYGSHDFDEFEDGSPRLIYLCRRA